MMSPESAKITLTYKTEILIVQPRTSNVLANADFPVSVVIGFACNKGTVHIGEAVADGENQTVRESFDTVPLVSLHRERMFPVRNE